MVKWKNGMCHQYEPSFLNDFVFLISLLSHDYGRVDLIVLHTISCFSCKKKKQKSHFKVQIDLDRGTRLPTSTGGRNILR